MERTCVMATPCACCSCFMLAGVALVSAPTVLCCLHVISAVLLQEVHDTFVVHGSWTPQDKSEDKLKDAVMLTFNTLCGVAKNMFLDCVSVLGTSSRSEMMAIEEVLWGDQGGVQSAFKELQRRALVSLDEDDDLMVHDVILTLGRAILFDRTSPFYGSRVWEEGDGKLVQFDQALQKPIVAIAITLKWVSVHLADYNRQLLAKLANGQGYGRVQLLLGGSTWVHLSSSNLQRCGLQKLCLGRCGRSTYTAPLPTAILQMTALQMLDLNDSRGLELLPEAFGKLTALRNLRLCDCVSLRSLPKSFGQLTALQKLDLSWHQQLRSLPESFGHLTDLQELDLSWCTQLQSLPESFGQLTALQKLDLSYCVQLRSLPKSFGQLTALQELGLMGCVQVSSLPQSSGQLTALQKLNLHDCEQLVFLPESLGQLKVLHTLDLSGCNRLVSLPDSFQQLTALEHLNLGKCDQLVVPPRLCERLTGLVLLNKRGSNKVVLPPELQ
eukprot:GHUV01013728.1.p1 GENE.GHUV01013728.1~~GHUV01013728.1.p1  ORF type:complete len:497 (+),score=123.32 GHUV01013728.1:918-2408(+)